MTVETKDTARLRGAMTCTLKFKTAVSAIALMTAFGFVQPAFATIDNTVTVTGSSPGNTDDVEATADETVDVEDAVPDLAVTKTPSFTGTDVGAGDTITYTYTVENTGNVTVTNVSLSDVHEGTGSSVTPSGMTLSTGDPLISTDAGGDQTYDSLAPGDIITWTADYVVAQGDINNNGGGDGTIDNTVTASATPVAGTFADAPFEADASVPLEAQDASLSVSKVADNDVNREVGDVITYTYVVTNTGNIPISGITVADDVTAGSGGNPTPQLVAASLNDVGPTGDSSDDGLDQEYDVLAPGDSVTYTGEYTVTQSDVDNLQ